MPVYFENFDNLPATGTGSTVDVTTYSGGVAADNETYTASPGWHGGNCMGWLLSANSTPGPAAADPCMTPGSDPAYSTNLLASQSMATALGEFQGETPTQAMDNHAVTGFTGYNGANLPSPPGGGVVVQTSPNTIPATPGHYYDISANFAAVDYVGGGAGCDYSDPQMMFSLLNGSTAIPLNSTPLDPCTAPGNKDIAVNGGNIRVATLLSNALHWTGGATMGMQLVDQNTATGGNDYAFDNPQIVDVTPQLDKSFSPASVPVGGSSALTFTITNTSELGAKTGWSFNDNLPTGLTLTGTSSTTCANATVTAPSGGTGVQVTGDLSQGMASCTVTVHVTSPATGTFTNGPSNVTANGLNPPGGSAVTFNQQLAINKTSAPAGPVSHGSVVTYTVTLSNPANTPYTGATFTDNLSGVLDVATLTGTPTATAGSVTVSGTNLTWNGNVPANGTVTVTYQVTVK